VAAAGSGYARPMRRTSAALVDWRVVFRSTAGPKREHRVMDPPNRIQSADGLPAFTVITTPAPSSAEPSYCSASHPRTGYAWAGTSRWQRISAGRCSTALSCRGTSVVVVAGNEQRYEYFPPRWPGASAGRLTAPKRPS